MENYVKRIRNEPSDLNHTPYFIGGTKLDGNVDRRAIINVSPNGKKIDYQPYQSEGEHEGEKFYTHGGKWNETGPFSAELERSNSYLIVSWK